jgi:hypothetical protein
VKLFPAGSVGRARMLTLLAASVRLNASPIASPDKVRELIHGECMMVAVPVTVELPGELAACPSSIPIVGAISNGFEVELNVPL